MRSLVITCFPFLGECFVLCLYRTLKHSVQLWNLLNLRGNDKAA